MDPYRKHGLGFPSYQALDAMLKELVIKQVIDNGTLWYHVENIETKKEYNEVCGLCTHMIILIYYEEIQ